MSPLKFLRSLFAPTRCADCNYMPFTLFRGDDGKYRCVTCDCGYHDSRPVATLETDDQA